MVAMFVTIDMFELAENKLNMNEYLTLMRFQHDVEKKYFPFEPDPRYYKRLEKDEFIKMKSYDSLKIYPVDDPDSYKNYELGPAGIALFDGTDLFEEFYKLFPARVSTGIGVRALSTLDPTGISGRATHEIWKRVTKKKPALQRKIIDCLKRELAQRQLSGQLAYMQGIDTWLRQATWEKWDVSSESGEDKRSSNSSIKL